MYLSSSSHRTLCSISWQVLYKYKAGPREIKPLKVYLGAVLPKVIWNREKEQKSQIKILCGNKWYKNTETKIRQTQNFYYYHPSHLYHFTDATTVILSTIKVFFQDPELGQWTVILERKAMGSDVQRSKTIKCLAMISGGKGLQKVYLQAVMETKHNCHLMVQGNRSIHIWISDSDRENKK